MIITCEACGTTYKLKGSLLQEAGTTVRCSKCEHVFTAYPQMEGTERPAQFTTVPDAARIPVDVPISEDTYKDAEETERELDSIFDETLIEDEEEEDTTDFTLEDELPSGNETPDADTATRGRQDSLFDDTEELINNFISENEIEEIGYDALERTATVGFEDLEITATETVGFDDLEITAAETIGFDDLVSEEDDVVSLGDLEQRDDTISLESLVSRQREAITEIDLEDLARTEAEDDSEVMEMDDLVTTGIEAEETAGEPDEEEADFDFSDLEDADVDRITNWDEGVQAAQTALEHDYLQPEEKGGSISELEDPDKTPEKKKPAKDSDDAGKDDMDDFALEPAGEDEDEFDLDFDLESEMGEVAETAENPNASDLGPDDLDLEDLDLDLTAETAGAAGSGETHQSGMTEEFDLDLDLTADVGDQSATAAEDTEEEEFDLELGATAEADLGLDDLDLDEFDLDLEEPREAAELDLDLDAGPASGDDIGEFELDFDEEVPVAEATGEFDLDLDFEAEAPAATDTNLDAGEEFELNLDGDALAEVPEVADAAGEEAFSLDLDLDFESGKTLEAADADAEEFDLELDLDAEAVTETAADEVGEFDLDLDEPVSSGATAEAFDIDLDFEEAPADDAGEFDLDLEEAGGATAEALDFDLDGPDSGGEEAFELDLDFDSDPAVEPDAAAGGRKTAETLDFDLDLEETSEERAGATAEVDDFDLDLDLGPEEDAVMADAGKAGSSEEFDLTEVEDFLDLEDEKASTETVVGGTDEFDLGLETAADVTPTEAAEEEEFDLDLETMLDEEALAGGDTAKEVSLETFADQRRAAEQRSTVKPLPMVTVEEIAAKPAAATVPEEGFEEVETIETFEEEPVAKAGARGKLGRRIMWAVLAVAMLAMLAAGVYFFFMSGDTTPVVQDAGNLRIAISTPDYRFVTNEKAGELLVVTGMVTNRYDHSRKSIQVQGNLYDTSGTLIRKSTAYAGNTFAPDALKTYDLVQIETELTNRKGDGVTPEGKIPFTVVFSNLPENMDELSVEVIASVKE